MKTKHFISALAAVAFVTSIAAPAYAQTAADKLAAACKGKKAGDEVTVDGKKEKCK